MKTTVSSTLTLYGQIIEALKELKNNPIIHMGIIIFRVIEMVILVLILAAAMSAISIITAIGIESLLGVHDPYLSKPLFIVVMVILLIGFFLFFGASFLLVNIRRASPRMERIVTGGQGDDVPRFFGLPLFTLIPCMVAVFATTTFFHLRVIIRYPIVILYEIIMRVLVSIPVGIGIGFAKLICLIPIKTEKRKINEIVYKIKNISFFPHLDYPWFDDSVNVIFAWITHPSYYREYAEYYKKIEGIREKKKSKVREARNEFLARH